jgi:phosphomannomutase
MLTLLAALRRKVATGYVGGSDLAKQQEQLGAPAGVPVTSLFDYCFAENGLTAFRLGAPLPSQSFIGWLGEAKYQRLAKFCLRHIAGLDLPVMRGTFVEFRNGMINVSPIGRNASVQERLDFQEYDRTHKVREKMIEALRAEFPDFGLTYSIGGQISFDVFPNGWDKRYCLSLVELEKDAEGKQEFTTVHFFGDKVFPGGNDWEIAQDPRTIEHAVKDPEETMAIIRKLYDL